MNEFIQKHYSLLTGIVELIAAIAGVIVYKKFKHTSAKYFIWFLIYLTLCEFIATYTGYIKGGGVLKFLKGTLIEKNYWWATLFWKIGAIIFFVFYYTRVLKTKQFRNIIKTSGFLFFVFSMVYVVINWRAFFVSYFPIISVLGAVIIFLCTVFYFIEVLQSNDILTFYKSLNFYISAAIFIWWLIITPIVFYDNYTSYQIDVYERDWNYIKLRRLLYLSANIFMYSTFTFALIFCKPEKNNTLVKD